MTLIRRNVTLVGITILSLGVLTASQFQKARLHRPQTNTVGGIKVYAQTARDASVEFKALKGDNHNIALINFRFVANGLWTTEEAVKRIKAAT